MPKNSFLELQKDFRELKKENEVIKYRTIRDIMNLFKQEDDYFKPMRGVIFGMIIILNMNIKEYLNKIKPYFRDTIIDFQKYGTLKVT